MRTARTASGRPVWKEWHERRRQAREEAMNIEAEYSREDRSDFSLEEDDPTYPLGPIPSGMRDENYEVEDPVSGEHHDLRDAHPYI